MSTKHNSVTQHLDAKQLTEVSCYIDMGIFYGSYIVEHCIKWWPTPAHIDKDTVDQFLTPIFAQLKRDGITQINLAFAQICDIDNLLQGEAGSQTDKISPILKSNYPVGDTGENFLKYLVENASSNETKVMLSFGGASASQSDMKISGDPTTEANNLADFMKEYAIDSVGFDIEGGGLTIMQVNEPSAVITFMKTLHTRLSKVGKASIITVVGSVQDGPSGLLKALFTDFDDMFDGVNLMLYSNSHYYLDADNPSWGIKQWLSYIPNSNKIHIGFYDKIPYENSSASAGEKYKIPTGLRRGQAAAYVYLQLLDNLKLSLSEMGQPFWWTDDPLEISSNKVMQDYYDYLRGDSP